MIHVIEKPLRLVFRRLKNMLKASDTVRKLVYDLDNTEEFSNLFEHEQMIGDTVRVNNYHKAITSQIKPGDVVLDLGTGTGILSFFAAKQNPKQIYSVDHSDFINVAEKIAKHNNINNISFVRTNSREFDPGEKVDVILHEQIGDDLLNENMIENILDLKKRLLKEGGRILPSKFELFIEPICYKQEYKIPYIWEKEVHGIDFSFLNNSDLVEKYKPHYYERRYLPASAFDCFLCEPEAVMSFDIQKLDSKDDLPSSFNVSKEVANTGSIDGFCVYFRVIFDEEIGFDTSPFNTHTHWGNRVFRTISRQYATGDTIDYEIKMGDLTKSETWSIMLAGQQT